MDVPLRAPDALDTTLEAWSEPAEECVATGSDGTASVFGLFDRRMTSRIDTSDEVCFALGTTLLATMSFMDREPAFETIFDD